MRITKIGFKNFKRFTDLTVENIPEDAKLVLLTGANGSGKSCVFDALHNFGQKPTPSGDYYLKNADADGAVSLTLDIGSELKQTYLKHGQGIVSDSAVGAHKFVGRSSIRIVPRLTSAYDTSQIQQDKDRPPTFIDEDTRFGNDAIAYMQIIDDALRVPLFDSGAAVDSRKIFRDFIEPLNQSLAYIFGGKDSHTIRIINYQNATPSTEPRLTFEKGKHKIDYSLLSHGEKQVVILLLNFIVRKSQYEDAIICIDEMDCHLNTSLQYRLLEEIVNNWIPDSSQLWTASHALGFIDYAQNNNNGVVIDLDNLDYDQSQTIRPLAKDAVDVYEIAVPKALMFELLKDKRLVLCENQNDEYYNLMQLKDTLFVGVRDARDLYLKAKHDTRYYALRDRDFLTDAEIAHIEQVHPNYKILRYYDFENYLYHPDNINELGIEGFDATAYRADIAQQKQTRLNYILLNVTSSRQGYEELKTNDKLRDKNTTSIADDLASEELERFYKYYDMKTQYNKSILSQLNIDKRRLVCTEWFRNRIAEILQ